MSISKKVNRTTTLSHDLENLKDALIDAQWIISDMEDKWIHEDSEKAQDAISQIIPIYDSLEKGIRRIDKLLIYGG